MKLTVRAAAMSCSAVLGLAVLFVGLINRFNPDFGWAFLKVLESVYPGFYAAFGLKNLIIGVIWALVYGASAGALLAVAYNAVLSNCPYCRIPKDKSPPTN